MKRAFFILSLLLALAGASAQPVYWVFLTDKAGTVFNPYDYFDAKAIERYRQCGADLYDISNYPLTQRYVDGVDAIATEEVGVSRWMNAVGVVATPAQAAAIAELPYVDRVQMIGGNMQLTSCDGVVEDLEMTPRVIDIATVEGPLEAQLVRMGGAAFREKGIDGKGVRIAVFDGGFPQVNTHNAFRHLRDNNQILKTWNFPNKKENVYGWNSHGTMTLSCIAGRMNDRDLGLATGAEFLLARTEVEAEPFKEEIWWMQAVEWADKNGANIISSSLGYGKDRYYTRHMDGTSYVARAGNLAARKGILVCNSAGNEGDDRTWQYIITPSDADSVLCVGGIENSLTNYNHISFSSFGPSADGRQKPNVCAFGYARTANTGKSDDGFHYVHGTSFSCPLVAGFAACAWQASPGKTAMQMFDLIQRSGDLYPYCDYAFGYGVPQATFFVGALKEPQPTFQFKPLSSTAVDIVFLHTDSNMHVFYKDVNDQGGITMYGKKTLSLIDTAVRLEIHGGRHLVVNCGGYTAEYRFEEPTDIVDRENWVTMDNVGGGMQVAVTDRMNRAPAFDIPNERPTTWGGYVMLGVPVSLTDGELNSRFWSPAKRLGVRWRYRFTKAYSLGLAMEYGHVTYRYNDRSNANDLERRSYVDAIVNTADKIRRRRLNVGEWSAEFFQRVRLLPMGALHNGLHWDLGAYITYMPSNNYQLTYRNFDDPVADTRRLTLDRLNSMEVYRWQWGATTRLTYDVVGVYARYRLSQVSDGELLLPKLEVGLQLQF